MGADFQEAFLALFWEPWAAMLGLLVAVTVIVAIYWIIARGFNFKVPSQASRRFAGRTGDDDEEGGILGTFMRA